MAEASGLTDWLGTPIEVGSKVATFGLGKFPQRTIGTVTRASNGSVTVEVKRRNSSWNRGKYTILGPDSVLVLVPELLSAADD